MALADLGNESFGHPQALENVLVALRPPAKSIPHHIKHFLGWGLATAIQSPPHGAIFALGLEEVLYLINGLVHEAHIALQECLCNWRRQVPARRPRKRTARCK